MTKTNKFNLHTFENEEIKFHKEQQLFLLERYKVTKESYDYWFSKFMNDTSNKDIELKMLKAFELMSYDLNNINSHIKSEMDARLRVASEMIKDLQFHNNSF